MEIIQDIINKILAERKLIRKQPTRKPNIKKRKQLRNTIKSNLL